MHHSGAELPSCESSPPLPETSAQGAPAEMPSRAKSAGRTALPGQSDRRPTPPGRRAPLGSRPQALAAPTQPSADPPPPGERWAARNAAATPQPEPWLRQRAHSAILATLLQRRHPPPARQLLYFSQLNHAASPTRTPRERNNITRHPTLTQKRERLREPAQHHSHSHCSCPRDKKDVTQHPTLTQQRERLREPAHRHSLLCNSATNATPDFPHPAPLLSPKMQRASLRNRSPT